MILSKKQSLFLFVLFVNTICTSQEYSFKAPKSLNINGDINCMKDTIFYMPGDSLSSITLEKYYTEDLQKLYMQKDIADSSLMYNPLSLLQCGDGFLLAGEKWDQKIKSADEQVNFVEGYACMYSHYGSLLWQHEFSGQGKDLALKADLNSQHEVFIAGVFEKELSIDKGINLESNGVSQNDIFLLKLDEEGDFLDIKQFHGYGETFVKELLCFNDSTIIIAGTFSDSFQYGSDKMMESKGKTDVFLCVLDKNLLPKNAIRFGGRGIENISKLVIDKDSCMYIIGDFQDEVVFDVKNKLISKGGFDTYILKMDFQGNIIWARQVGGKKNDFVYDLKLKDSYLYISSKIRDVETYGHSHIGTINGPYSEMVMMRMDKNGNEIDAAWMQDGTAVHTSCLAVTEDQSIYLAGSFRNELVLAYDTLEALDGENTFIVKLEKECPELDIKLQKKSNFCDGDSVLLIASPDFTSYSWNDSITGESIYVKKAGTYTLEASFLDECIAFDSIEVQIEDMKSVNFSYEIYPNSGTVFLRDETGMEDISWLWDFGDQSEPGTNQYPVHDYESSGLYTVSLTIKDDQGCSETISQVIYIEKSNTEIDEIDGDNYSLRISPNPSSDILILNYHLPLMSDINYYIYDAVGNLEGKYNILDQPSGEHQKKLGVSHLSPGIYILRFMVNDEDGLYNKELKFCVIH